MFSNAIFAFVASRLSFKDIFFALTLISEFFLIERRKMSCDKEGEHIARSAAKIIK